MEKLNRVRWAGGFSFRVYGVRFGIRSTDADVLPQMERYLPPGAARCDAPAVRVLYSVICGDSERRPGPRRFSMVYRGSWRVARTLELQTALEALESDLHIAVATSAGRRLFLKAGVVGIGGKAIVVIGPPSSGRSTLVEALIKLGASYYSDEYAVLDKLARIHPYPNRAFFRSLTDSRGQRISIEELARRPGRDPLPVGLIVDTAYREGCYWRPRPATRGQTALRLLTHAVTAHLHPQSALKTVTLMARTAAAVRGPRGEAIETAKALLKRLGEDADLKPMTDL